MHTTPLATRRAAIALLLALVLGLVGCAKSDFGASDTKSAPNQPGQQASSAAPTPEPSALPVTISVKPKHGVKAALPTDPLIVKATNGTVSDVRVQKAGKKPVNVAGTLTGTTWKPKRNFVPDTKYTVKVTATDSLGAPVTATKSFRTLKPETTAQYYLLYTDQTVGVGMPATIQFASPVETKKMRAEVERNVQVTTKPAQAGSWGWLDNRQLMWRPKGYFKPGTKVTITANLAGIQTGKKKWVGRDAKGSFTVGAAHITKVSISGHYMKVYSNGKLIRTMPVTNGKPGFTTRSGTKVVIERIASLIMDSESIGIGKNDKEAYRLKVYWAVRTTWTGEFVHGAPWSVGSQGYANVSHGCTGMNLSNARWFYNFSRPGDLVIYSGSGRTFYPTEGIGVWQYSWKGWQKQSALS